jgi:MFS transporter, OFA family, oxalate/formate antiporter
VTLADALPRRLSARLPFFYGWVVLGCICCAGFARQGAAVATLSIFVEPLTHAFGWSRTALSGAVSLGGLLAAVAAPWLGPVLDRHGSRLVLCVAILVTGGACLLLSLTPSLLFFYAVYCVARMSWAAPFDLGIYGAVANWFVARRAFATSIATLAQMAGLAVMPLLAQWAIAEDGWRAGWLALGAATLLVGLVPCWLFLVRRPEDLGLTPDRAPAADAGNKEEPAASRREALRSPAFWLLLLYTVLVYPVQAGVSLHQAPNLIERGIGADIAATIVGTFSLATMAGTVLCAVLPRRLEPRWPLAATGALLGAGALLMSRLHSAPVGYLAASLFGLGVGGVMTLLPFAWAQYFGRAHFGAVRGIALSAQVLAQAVGPLFSGAMRDWSGSYALPFTCFAGLSLLSIGAALAPHRPRRAALQPIE